VYDEITHMTSMEGVFAGGDCGNDKISIAIESIGDAGKCAASVDSYLRGEPVAFKPQYIHTRDDIDEKTFEDRERLIRERERVLPPEQRRGNFGELRPDPFSAEQAAREASRCLECGCGDFFDCKLVAYAREYGAQPWRFDGEKHRVEYEDLNDHIIRDPNKCILCGLCVRVCSDAVGAGALGFTERGFDATVSPALGRPLAETNCVSCGNCVALCPTGALQERSALRKQVPLQTEKTVTACSRCNAGCEVCFETHGELLVRAVPANGGLLCKQGRFEFDRLPSPLPDAELVERAGALAARLKSGSAAIAVSPRLTNEDAAAVKALADSCGAKLVLSIPGDDGMPEPGLARRISGRGGALEIKPYANLRGLSELGITDGADGVSGIKTLVIFGDAPASLPSGVDFVAHCAPSPLPDADAAIPCSPYGDGTFTGENGATLPVRAAVKGRAPGYAAAAAAIAAAL
jgi:formate dehydrogenase major subunit